jgi:hypothetical protein
VVEIHFKPVRGEKPQRQRQLADFKKLLEHYADEIVQDWNNYEMCFPVADLYDGNI